MTALTNHKGLMRVTNIIKCEYWTQNKQLLQRHHLGKHEGVNYCTDCEKKYSDKKNLKEHQLSKHEGVIYECDQCNYSASRPESLKLHKTAIHNEGVKYACDQCSYKGTTKTNLRIHQPTRLPGVVPQPLFSF